MKRIGNECPAKTGGIGLFQNRTQPPEKWVSVFVVKKYLLPGDTAHNDMMKRTMGVYSGSSRHSFAYLIKM